MVVWVEVKPMGFAGVLVAWERSGSSGGNEVAGLSGVERTCESELGFSEGFG